MEGTFVLSSKSKSAASAVCLQLTKLTGVCLHTDMEMKRNAIIAIILPFDV